MVKWNIGLAVSCFYPQLANLLEKGALQTLKQFQKKNQILLKVKKGYTPGCSELPLMADRLFHKKCSASDLLRCGDSRPNVTLRFCLPPF